MSPSPSCEANASARFAGKVVCTLEHVRHWFAAWSERSVAGQLSQDGVEDSAVAIVDHFDGGIDAAGGDEVDDFAIGFASGDFDGLSWFEFIIEADIEGFCAVESE